MDWEYLIQTRIKNLGNRSGETGTLRDLVLNIIAGSIPACGL